ncbi:MAG: hypothetical protein KIS79_04320 [Burkholderiales bacterium]|nr:hypothetical protein [Burkholderiales bacterium]
MNRQSGLLFGALLGAVLTTGLLLYTDPSHADSPATGQTQSPSQADAIIQAAPPSAFDQLLGPFQPGNPLEKDILAAALLDIEGRQLQSAAMAGDAAARARRREIVDTINAYEKQHASLRDAGMPFGYQWRVLSGQLQSASIENLMPRIRELYETKYGARDAASHQQAAQMLAAEQKAAERAKQVQGTSAEGAQQAAAACGPTADGTRFDPGDINQSLRWWIARTGEVGAAQRSGNQLRVDAAQQQFRRQLACLVNQRINYTFRVQRHPIRNDPAISAQGVLIGIYHATDDGVIRVGVERDARGVTHVESAPILLRAGQDIDASVLPDLSTRSTFIASARIARTGVLGATSLRPPTLILFVTDVRLEQVRP